MEAREEGKEGRGRVSVWEGMQDALMLPETTFDSQHPDIQPSLTRDKRFFSSIPSLPSLPSSLIFLLSPLSPPFPLSPPLPFSLSFSSLSPPLLPLFHVLSALYFRLLASLILPYPALTAAKPTASTPHTLRTRHRSSHPLVLAGRLQLCVHVSLKEGWWWCE